MLLYQINVASFIIAKKALYYMHFTDASKDMQRKAIEKNLALWLRL